jgi:hypothetical protein
MGGGGGGDGSGEIVGERPPVGRGRGRGRGGRHLSCREALRVGEAGTLPLFSNGISSAPPFPANLRGHNPINGNTLTGECLWLPFIDIHCPLRPLYFSPLQCLLPKQIFPYITTPPSTRLIEFTARPHLTLPLPSTSHPPQEQQNPTPLDVHPDPSLPMTDPNPNPVPVPPTLPELPVADLSATDFSHTLESIFGLPSSS